MASGLVRALPNALTVLRLALGIAFPLVPAEWRLGVVAAAAISDAVDGTLARWLGATTPIGALLDGVADKVVAALVIGTFAALGMLEWWEASLLLARDVTVVLIYAWVALRRNWASFRTIAARPLGKATTLFLFAYMLAALGWTEAAPALKYAAAGASVIAAVDYLLVLRRAAAAQRVPVTG